MKVKYANLTNGIEAIDGNDWRFIRIQSTACEQKRWAFILEDLDNDLLMNLALGNHCEVYDFGHEGEPRALWQGLVWIRYALTRAWCDREEAAYVRGCNVTRYFAEQYDGLPDRTLSKLRYFKKFARGGDILLFGVWGQTKLDGQYPAYADMLQDKGLRFEMA